MQTTSDRRDSLRCKPHPKGITFQYQGRTGVFAPLQHMCRRVEFDLGPNLMRLTVSNHLPKRRVEQGALAVRLYRKEQEPATTGVV